jgi:hypothetical protein
VGAGRSDGAHRAGVPDRGRDRRIAFPPSVCDVAQMLDDVAAEAVGEPKVDRNVKGRAALAEVLVDLACCGV